MTEQNLNLRATKEVAARDNEKPARGRRLAAALVAVLVLGLCFSEEALARGGHGGGGHGGGHGGHGTHGSGQGGHAGHSASRSRTASRSNRQRNRSYARNHRWGQSRYYAQYGCNLYYDNGEACWYYWCQPDDCYYPTDYCPYGTYSWE
jgi:hypothetical protein